MSNQHLGPDDYGLTDPQVLEVATHMAPALFLALRVAHILDGSRYPLNSVSAVEDALRAVSTEPDQFSHAGMRITVADARQHFPADFLPVVDRLDLLRKSYQAILIGHRASARSEWAKIQAGPGVTTYSHPMPTEGF